MFKNICLFLFVLPLTFNVLTQNTERIPLNQIRILASHNSYKKQPHPKVIKFLNRYKKRLGTENDPEQIDYGHDRLEVQLDSFHIRGFELDVNYDPKGGLYYKRSLNGFIPGLAKRSKQVELKKPGFKLLHIADVDYETNYYTLKSALKELKKWSLNHPNHEPLFVNIEAKGFHPGNESKLLKFLGFKRALPFTEEAYMALDKEILEEIPRQMIFTPSDLKSTYYSVRERLENIGWPTIQECSGKIFFILEGHNQHQYNPEGQDRPMFVYSQPNGEHTAFVVRNEPQGKEAEIRDLTARYIVRTRSDAGTIEARKNDYQRFQAAMRSGAQIISTDYYRPDKRFSNFFIQLKGE
jgi:hypothetical protein